MEVLDLTFGASVEPSCVRGRGSIGTFMGLGMKPIDLGKGGGSADGAGPFAVEPAAKAAVVGIEERRQAATAEEERCHGCNPGAMGDGCMD